MELTEITAEASATLSYLLRAQEMVAANVANVNQAGYIAKSVDFQMFLESLSTSGSLSSETVSSALEGAVVKTQEGSVSLDEQIAQSEHISMRYGDLLEVLGRHLSLYSIATNKGR
jgi:flagellar basal body rod protein FlgB